MKCYLKIVIILCVLMIGSLNLITLASGEVLLSTGIRYDAFQDDLDPDTTGTEFTIPLGVAYKQQWYSLSLETAYSQAAVDPGEEARATLSGLTDMLLSVAYTYNFANRPLGLFAGLNANLPTGQENLSEQEQFAEAGESNDLFEVDNFGDGLNVGVTLGLIRDFERMSLGIQGGYVYNGEYDSTQDVPDDDLKPGDQILGIALFGWQISSRITLSTSLTYSHFFPDKSDGEETYQLGDKIVVGVDLRREGNPIGVVVSLQGTVQSKNKEQFDDKLQIEEKNSNGADLFGLIDITYAHSKHLTLRLLGDIRYYGESDLKNEPGGLPFEGCRVRYAIGPGFAYRLNEHLSCDGLLKLHLMHQDADVLQDQDVIFQGLNLDVGLTYMF